MKKRLLHLGLSALLAFGAGCFSMDAAPMRLRTLHGVPTEHVVIANNGWYLFNAWPLACGNAYEDATFWTNEAMAQYFGVKSVRVE